MNIILDDEQESEIVAQNLAEALSFVCACLNRSNKESSNVTIRQEYNENKKLKKALKRVIKYYSVEAY